MERWARLPASRPSFADFDPGDALVRLVNSGCRNPGTSPTGRQSPLYFNVTRRRFLFLSRFRAISSHYLKGSQTPIRAFSFGAGIEAKPDPVVPPPIVVPRQRCFETYGMASLGAAVVSFQPYCLEQAAQGSLPPFLAV